MALSACGEQDSGRAAFIAEAAPICAQAGRADTALQTRIDIAQRGADSAAVYREVGRLTRRRADSARAALDRLDGLTVANADRDAVKSWLADRRRREGLALELARAFAQARDARIAILSQRIDALDRAAAPVTARYRLSGCAGGDA